MPNVCILFREIRDETRLREETIQEAGVTVGDFKVGQPIYGARLGM